MADALKNRQSRTLIWYGVILFLLGLLTGFAIPLLRNPRMGLSSHLEALMNGMFLILLGLLWPRLSLSAKTLKITFALALFGAYTNWITTFLAAFWGAGAAMMPLAGGEFHGAAWQEIVIKAGLVSLSLSMVIVCVVLVWGLRGCGSARREEGNDMPEVGSDQGP